MTKAKKRFQLVPGLMSYPTTPEGLGQYGLMIEDYLWWANNEREILNWMVEHLPQGADHHAGMFVYFPTDNDRIMFLLKWG